MPYVQRDGNGDVTGVSRWPGAGFDERVADDDPDLLAYFADLTRERTPAELLAARMQGDPVTRGLIRALAARNGDANENTLIAEIVAAADQP